MNGYKDSLAVISAHSLRGFEVNEETLVTKTLKVLLCSASIFYQLITHKLPASFSCAQSMTYGLEQVSI